MKKILPLLLIHFFVTAACAQNFILHIKNNAHINLTYSTEVLHGIASQLPQQIAADQSITVYFNPNIFTGSEGYVSIFPDNQLNDRVTVYCDNPFIGEGTYAVNSSSLLLCKPTKWQILNKGNDCELFVEISSTTYGKPTVVALNTNGTIKGSLLWDKNNIQSPEVNPYSNAFTCKVLAPTQFIESAGPFTLERTGTYNGRKGFFEGSKEVGSVTYETVASFNPNFVEIRYTVTGVPTDIPIIMDITTDYTKSNWLAGPQKPKPGNEYVFVVGTFPSTVKSTVTLDNNLAQLNAVDFNCDGDWLKVDPNTGIVGGSAMVNKIAARKNMPVLPGSGMIVATKTVTASSQVMATPAMQTKTQQVEVQKVRTAGAVKIRQQ
ncbi:hypothetical protein [Ferruginibacter sp.]